MKPTLLDVENLNDAMAELCRINSHPVGIQIMALKAVFRVVRFDDVDPKIANIVKQEMLSRGGDAAVSRTVGMFENDKTSLIVMGTLAQYVRLVRKLRRQPYGDCVQISEELRCLLLEDVDIDTESVL